MEIVQVVLPLKLLGGVYPFQYTWSDPTISGNNPSNLPAGNYHVTIEDAIDSLYILSVEIIQPN